MKPMGIAIFSYNRGNYLKHSLDSALRLTGSGVPVAVFDDGSDDGDTLAVLNRAGRHKRVQVFVGAHVDPHENLPRGGLYRNMDLAITWAKNLEIELILFLQDDIQLVRQVTEFDQSQFQSYFDCNPDSLQLYVLFSPFHNTDAPGSWRLDSSEAALLPISRESRPFSAVGLFSVSRVVAQFGSFEASERANGARAYEAGLKRGMYRWPIGMFMPFPKTDLNRKLRHLSRLPLSERIAGSGVHPYRDMNSVSVRKLFATEALSTMPARQWLDCPSMNHRRLWSYYGGPRDLRAVGGLRGMIGAAFGGFLQIQRPSKP